MALRLLGWFWDHCLLGWFGALTCSFSLVDWGFMFVEAVLSFGSTHLAMAADKALGQAGVEFTMIPTPTPVSAGCGISLRLRYDLLDRAKDVLAAQPQPIEADMHGIDEQGTYTRL